MLSVGLRTKITVLVISTTLILMTVSFLVISHLETRISIEQMKRHSTVLGESIQRTVAQAIRLSEEDHGQLQKIAVEIRNLEGIEEVEIYDRNLAVIAHGDPKEIGETVSDEDLIVTRVFESGEAIERNRGGDKQEYERFIPIRSGKGSAVSIVAVAEVVFSTKDVIASVRDFQLKTLILAIGLSAALAILLTYFLRWTITDRIVRLGKLADELSRGKLHSRIKIDSSDEIGRLGESLNSMAGKLETARAYIENKLEVQREIDRLKDNFLAMVSHELRTPLTAVVTLSDAMLEGYTGEITAPQRHSLQRIREKGEHLNALIDNILDLEKIQSGRMKMELETVSLDSVIHRAVSMVQAQAQDKGVVVTNRFNLELEPFAMDAVKIQSIISNLIGNAIKFTHAKGRVEISANLTGDMPEKSYVEILVSDTGIGIPPEEQDKIFHRFYQVQEPSKREFSGAGLGLALARSFAMAHGGWLNLKERSEWSTTFSLGLPIGSENLPRPLYIYKTRFNLPSMIKGIIRMLEEEHGYVPGIEVSWPKSGGLREVEADREYFRSILINIFQNSIRYRQKESIVKVGVSSSNEELRLVIENEGLQFPPEELKRILSPKIGEGEDSKSYHSLFSLRVTHEILLSHGGRLEIENISQTIEGIERGGVRFTIRIPDPVLVPLTKGETDNGKKEDIDH